jgi:Glycosyl transferase family 2
MHHGLQFPRHDAHRLREEAFAVTVDSNPVCVEPLAQRRRRTDQLRVDASAELPREVVDVLRLRGVARGPVLLLTASAAGGGGREAAPQFQLTCGALNEAPALASRGDFAAVVLILDGSSGEFESTLAAIAPRLAPGTLLVALSPPARGSRHAHAADNRDSAHLSLLRFGYDRVWVHSHRKQLCISAQRGFAAPAIRTCSILVPVFNEKATFPELMRTLLAKRLDHLGLEREIILIESNSSDGTRELVAGFAATPGVRIIYQDCPRGKGHAVRAGLAVATGDIVLIQDADLEYDLNDYDALLEPLLANRAAFVLGCRHGGRFRMRRFPQQRLLGDVLNIAHVLLAGLINVLYRQNMKDPFTMFKVFRRDCLYGLEFECDGFDFDHELVIKLVLKGYRPLEIPVNYCARSFSQGKKIRLFRDPPALIAADLKYRLQRLRPRFE